MRLNMCYVVFECNGETIAEIEMDSQPLLSKGEMIEIYNKRFKKFRIVDIVNQFAEPKLHRIFIYVEDL
jgi:hypothetical protein